MMNLRQADMPSSRRSFLKGAVATAGTFVLGSFVPFGRFAAAEGEAAAPKAVFDPNLFLRISSDDTVTVLLKHLEMGQGVSTGLATLVAEELDADWSKVGFDHAPNDPKVFNNLFFGSYIGTGGSTSMANSWTQMRQVGAAARAMFVAAAARKWNVPAAEITISDGLLSHASGKSARLGELVDAAMQEPVPTEVALKDPKDWKYIGARLPRLDSKSKTTGTATFAIDFRRPGMLTAMVARPPQFGGTVASFDDAETRKMPGVVEVVQVPSGVAVLAKDTWAAMRGREALKITWNLDQAEKRSTDAIVAEYRDLAAKPGLAAARRGDAVAGLSGADSHEAEFLFPFLAHAPMEPMNCVIELTADGAEIWGGSQFQSIDDYSVAQVLGTTPDKIRIHTLLGGGSFGRRANAAADWAVEAAQIAKAIGGKAPVHLLWSREDDIKGGFYRPMALHRVKAGLRDGRIAGWQHAIVAKSILAGTPFEGMMVKDGVDATTVEGVSDTPYTIENFAVDVHNAKTPVPVLWWRSVGHSHTAHVMETTMDELAHKAGQDPLAFRLAYLKEGSREAGVLKLAAEKGQWGKQMPKGSGQGIAFHHSFGSYVAMVAVVTVGGDGLKVERITAAVDCGIAINPDVIAAQVEGAIGFALSAVLRNRVTFKEGVVEQSNFDDYEPTRIKEMPAVEVHLVKSAEAPTGIGEPGLPPLAPSIGNAIFAATGKRLRSLPFDGPISA
ncbi:molybdopterin cofactor-binding domain-containing protein [Dongia sp.]|jgi:isoquinoline 1-oxidoreductase beta subunit|uniref:xanthine dehydrogenase family protein molybdopterin-binding subunit n=1 Tax=Dongia sp. TaxID=1977262 RepID=UPI0035AF9C47